VTRPTLADLADLHRFVLSETGSDESAVAAVLRAYSLSGHGRIERRPTQAILEAVCQHFGVELNAMLGKRRPATLARARHVAMSLLVATGMPLAEAGEAIGHSKGDAAYACRRVDRDERLQAEAATVAAIVAERAGEPGGRLPVIWPNRRSV
jgi:chromosomal replication initiation ATPase DnaA